MPKIPVGATIAHAYRFALGGFLKVLGIIWLPWLILAVGGFLLRSPTLALSTAITARNFVGISHLLIPLVPFYLVTVILLFMQITGVMQQALGLRTGSPYYYFSLGMPIWRLIGAVLLTALILIGSYILLLAAGIVLGIVTTMLIKAMNLSSTISTIFFIVAAIAAFCAYFYCLVRVTFFLNPVVIAEARISLKRGWLLGGGNFWRIVIVMLAVLVPILVVQLVLMFGFLAHGLPPTAPLHATADELAANRMLAAAWNANMIKRSADYWYLVYPVYAVIAALFYGLICSAQSFAYRAMVLKPV
jgi:hypothetical protein